MAAKDDKGGGGMTLRKTALCLAAASALWAAPAQALVMVVGNALAHDCFTTAKIGKDPLGGIATCNMAIDNELLSPHDRAATMVNRAAMEMQLNRVTDAMADYNQGIVMFPTMGDAYVDRAGAYITQKRFDEAMSDVNKGLELGPSYPFVGYYNRAVAEQLTGNYHQAYLDYQKTLALEPKFTPAADRLKDYFIAKEAPPVPAPAP
jgi:tetratricopeptide (TPR) repeat protein